LPSQDRLRRWRQVGDMRLFLVHCGFYDEEISEGIYEFHVNIPVVATTSEEAKVRARADPAFKKRKMHIDGIQEIRSVSGYEIRPVPSPCLPLQILAHPHRDL
jgi:hypothetical protein